MYDLIIIGGGPGGYNAAIHAAKQGLKVLIFEKDKLGGVCLNNGCIPTKFLLKTAHNFELIKNSQKWGIQTDRCSFDLEKIVQESQNIIKKLGSGIKHLFESNKVEWINQFAFIKDYQFLEVIADGKSYFAKNIIIATGSEPRVLSNFSKKKIWSINQALEPQFIPKKLCIIGAGAIGMEFADFYSCMGSSVTIFEMNDRILPQIDEDLSEYLQKHMQNKGIEFHLNSSFKQDEEKNFDIIMNATGVIPNTKLFEKNIELENGHIKTNFEHETNIKNIFAIGDCAAQPWLAHKAMAQGLQVVDKILGKKINKISNIPMCIYTNPQIAIVGLKENEIAQEVIIKKAQFRSLGIAIAVKEEVGFIKLIFSKKTHELLGAHIIGHEASELIHSFVLGMNLEVLLDDFQNTIFPHPSFSEIIFEAVL